MLEERKIIKRALSQMDVPEKDILWILPCVEAVFGAVLDATMALQLCEAKCRANAPDAEELLQLAADKVKAVEQHFDTLGGLIARAVQGQPATMYFYKE